MIFATVLAAFSLPAGAAPWVGEAGQIGAQYGVSAANAGDVNGDGFDDLIVGAAQFSNGEDREGRAFIYFGGPNGLAASPGWTAEIDQQTAEFGISVAGAGDVNGDGFDDVIIGAHFFDNGQSNEGGAFVYHGGPGGPSNTPDWSAESNQVFALLGASVAGVGDVNGDGFDDVIVGAYLFDQGETEEGAAFVYYGSSTGLSLTPNWAAYGNQTEVEFGRAVAGAGDVNGDGFDDVLVGAPFFDNGQPDEGRAYLYMGSSEGLGAAPAWTGESNQGGGQFGWDVAHAGDVNGDGFDDIVVGANRYDNGDTNEGRAFVYHGSGAGLAATPDWVADGNQAWALFAYSAAGVGDLNGDGYDDLGVGVLWFDEGEDNEGALFVFPGTEDGLTSVPNFSFKSGQAHSGLGGAVGGMNANGDPFSDVFVGAFDYDNGEMDEGRLFLFPGSGLGVIQGPQPPVITTDGGNGIGADFVIGTPEVRLDGTNGADAAEVLVNGSNAGVTRPTPTTWRFDGTLVLGPNLFVVTTVDELGNPSIPDIITVSYQQTVLPPPVITTDGGNGPGEDFFTTEPEWTITGSTVTQTENIEVNGATDLVEFTAGDTAWQYLVTLVEGPNVIEVRAVDAQGVASDPATVTITLDNLSPDSPTITTDGGNGPGVDFFTTATEILLEGTVDADAVDLRVNGGSEGVNFTPGDTTWSVTVPIADGPNTFAVDAADEFGNRSGASVITITRDLLPPGAPVITTDGGNGPGADFLTNDPFHGIAGATDADTAQILVNGSGDGVVYNAGQTTWSYSGELAEGANAIEVTAVDDAGNESEPNSITVTLDTIAPEPPVITTNNGEDFSTEDTSALIEGTAVADAVAITVNGSGDDVTFDAGSGAWSYGADLSVGANPFDIRAHDEAGNVSAPASITITRSSTGIDVSAEVTLAANKDAIDLGESIVVSGVFSLTPPPKTGALEGAGIRIRYLLPEVVEVTGFATVDANHKFQDTYTPSRAGTWLVQARFDGLDTVPATDWTEPIEVVVLGDDTDPLHPADLNRDGRVNALDVQLMINAVLLDLTFEGREDVNKDGAVNAADIQLVINAALGIG